MAKKKNRLEQKIGGKQAEIAATERTLKGLKMELQGLLTQRDAQGSQQNYPPHSKLLGLAVCGLVIVGGGAVAYTQVPAVKEAVDQLVGDAGQTAGNIDFHQDPSKTAFMIHPGLMYQGRAA